MAFSSGTFSRLFDWTTDRDAGIKIRADRFDQELDGFATGLSTTILKDGTQTTTAVVPFAFGISIVDNKAITLGTNSDITIQYDETTNDSLEIAAAVEGAALGIVLKSDQGDDNADQHKLSIADGGTLTLASKISGSFVTYLTHTPNATVASSTLAVAGNLTVGGNLTLGSGAELSEAELEMLDGITAGTVAASKAVVVDANKDAASFRNITLTGELDAGSLDVSGDADIDGTLEADAMTLNGSAITTTATLSTGISNGNVLVATSGIADNDFLKVDGTSIEGRSASEVLSDIGGQASLTFGISNTNAVKIDSASVADDEFARFTANGLESRSAAETLSDIGASPVAGSSSIVTTGALNAGSITSGFGAIDNGSSAITTTGAISGGSATVSGDLTVDTNTLKVDASEDTVCINTTDTNFDAGADDLIVGSGSGDSGITIYTGANAGDNGSIFFADSTVGSDAEKKGQISYEQNNEIMRFFVNATERFHINLAGQHFLRPTTTQGTSDVASGFVPTDGAVYGGGFATNGGRDNNTGFLAGFNICNNNNSTNGGGASGGRIVASMGGTVVTSDTNSGDDSGGTLDLYTKADGGNITKHFSIASDGTLTATDTSIGSISDERLKKDIVDFTYNIDDFKKYKPRKFNWKNPELHQHEENVIGFVAQELETVDNRFVYSTQHTEKDGREKDKEFIDEDGVVKASKLLKKDAMYISVIQQLITRIEALENK